MRGNGKLRSRSVKGVFVGLGLPLGSLAYLVRLDTRVIRTSDVTFTELQAFVQVSDPLPTVSTLQPSTACIRSAHELESVPSLHDVPYDPVGLAAPVPCISEHESPVSVPPAEVESVCSHGASVQTDNGLSMPVHAQPECTDELHDCVLSFTPTSKSDSPDQVQLNQPAPYPAPSPDVTVPPPRHPAAVPLLFPTNLPPLPPTPPDTRATDALSDLLNSPAPELDVPSDAVPTGADWFQSNDAQFFASNVQVSG